MTDERDETKDQRTVVLVDDNGDERRQLAALIAGQGYRCITLPDSWELMSYADLSEADCLIIDYDLKGIGGPAMLQRIQASGVRCPPIIVIGPDEVILATHAMRLGAIDYLPKPVSRPLLYDALPHALDPDRVPHRMGWRDKAEIEAIKTRLQQLSTREQEVLRGICDGQTSKQIGLQLGITNNTISFHRKNLLKKMQASNSPDLVRMISKVE